MQQKLSPNSMLLSALFTLTGTAVALLGAAMPAMIRQWDMSDRRGGLVLLLAWGGCTSGVLFTRGDMTRSAMRGVFFSAIGLLGLSMAGRNAALPFAAVYGIGLGIAMTSICILRSSEVDSTNRSREMNRLNSLWAAGACSTPLITLRALHWMSLSNIFAGLGLVFLIGLTGLLLSKQFSAQSDTSIAPVAPAPSPRSLAPFQLILLAACAVGIESSLNGWLTTFASRTTQSAGAATSVNTAFWAGLLFSRALHAGPHLPWLRSRSGILLHMAATLFATAFLTSAPGGLTLVGVALLAGLGLGPLYPFALSIALPRYRSTGVFLMAGAASAVFPWLTGVLSTSAGSLTAGLIVPCAVAVTLLLPAGWLLRQADLASFEPAPTRLTHRI